MTPEVPRPAPAFRLPGLRGGDVEGPVEGAYSLLVFTKASCPTCRWAAPHFRTLSERAPGNLNVIGIAQDDANSERAFADEAGLTYPIGLEPSPWSTSAAYGLETVPSAVLVDDRGRVVQVSAGFARDDLNDAFRRAAGEGPSTEAPLPESVPAFRPG